MLDNSGGVGVSCSGSSRFIDSVGAGSERDNSSKDDAQGSFACSETSRLAITLNETKSGTHGIKLIHTALQQFILNHLPQQNN